MAVSSGAGGGAPSAGDPRFDAACTALFGPHLAARAILDAGRDRRLRRPDLAHGIAAARGWLPPRARTVKIVGSKGKGGVARRIAQGLQALGDGPVGLFVSPEEIDHNDRIRIDGAPLSKTAFADLWDALKPAIDAAAARRDPAALSPFGALYLIALAAFAAARARWVVLEAGRGGRWDEVGWTPAATGLATRLLPEHRDRLGMRVGAIADQKLGGLGDVDRLFAHPTFAPFSRADAVAAHAERAPDRPFWLAESDALADAALAALGAPAPPPTEDAASFFRRRVGETALIADGAIHPDCVDRAFYSRLGDAAAIVATPADKDGAGVVDAIRGCGLPCATLGLIGPRGAGPQPDAAKDGRLEPIGQTDRDGLADRVARFADATGARQVVLLGDQTALRLARRLPLVNGDGVNKV